MAPLRTLLLFTVISAPALADFRQLTTADHRIAVVARLRLEPFIAQQFKGLVKRMTVSIGGEAPSTPESVYAFTFDHLGRILKAQGDGNTVTYEYVDNGLYISLNNELTHVFRHVKSPDDCQRDLGRSTAALEALKQQLIAPTSHVCFDGAVATFAGQNISIKDGYGKRVDTMEFNAGVQQNYCYAFDGKRRNGCTYMENGELTQSVVFDGSGKPVPKVLFKELKHDTHGNSTIIIVEPTEAPKRRMRWRRSFEYY